MGMEWPTACAADSGGALSGLRGRARVFFLSRRTDGLMPAKPESASAFDAGSEGRLYRPPLSVTISARNTDPLDMHDGGGLT